MGFPARIRLLHLKVSEDGDCQDSQCRGAEDAAIAASLSDSRWYPAEKGGDQHQGGGHRQGETVVIDVDIENDFSQESEGIDEDGQAEDKWDTLLRILSTIDEINSGNDANHD